MPGTLIRRVLEPRRGLGSVERVATNHRLAKGHYDLKLAFHGDFVTPPSR
jgi:hypothetical protein